MDKKKYVYDGPVYINDYMVTPRWVGATYAPSLNKAISNLKYSYKAKYAYRLSETIALPGNIKVS